MYKIILKRILLVIYVIKRLKELREDNDITQRQVAEYLNIKQNTYSQYETGKRDISVTLLSKLADYYGVSIDYIVGRTDNSGEI